LPNEYKAMTESAAPVQRLHLCRGGYEAYLKRELADAGAKLRDQGIGWMLDDGGGTPADLCFAHATLLAPLQLSGGSVNALAGAISEHFLQSVREERFEGAWPLLFDHPEGADGLGRRVKAVAEATRELLRKRMARVLKLAVDEAPRGPQEARGLFVYFIDFQTALVARSCRFGGQRRMADDPAAPSRSYLKAEEAYVVLGREPAAGETVVDLGAAPGGWSYSAAKRGARVMAIDNGPLKGGALDHPEIDHRREDAFHFAPPPGAACDWLFCDMVEDPHRVLELVRRWLEEGWCRRFVVNLKFGRVDPIALLAEVRDGRRGLTPFCSTFRARHLFHDREEFSLVGERADSEAAD
jgi:23S rRNA (cytidine2498-2'-O)-methyltransferase